MATMNLRAIVLRTIRAWTHHPNTGQGTATTDRTADTLLTVRTVPLTEPTSHQQALWAVGTVTNHLTVEEAHHACRTKRSTCPKARMIRQLDSAGTRLLGTDTDSMDNRARMVDLRLVDRLGCRW